jgi:hypothetical protein
MKAPFNSTRRNMKKTQPATQLSQTRTILIQAKHNLSIKKVRYVSHYHLEMKGCIQHVTGWYKALKGRERTRKEDDERERKREEERGRERKKGEERGREMKGKEEKEDREERGREGREDREEGQGREWNRAEYGG